ncbi:hypothetical protein [Luteimonas sp. YGD11-2]|uniref:hypothetical protein n=1 Tax=Luteimonas sp. YGD11-2 TaxID=2508168 RepID=UPI00100AE381|nr:hypothetical protein [Luteimonas sp. YGD11-2]
MGQITRTTNPTGLAKIDKKHFVVRVAVSDTAREFWLESFDYSAAQLSADVDMACIAHAGNTEQYFDLGPVSGFNGQRLSLRDLATDRPLRFRFVFNNPGEARLIGYTDGVRALDEAGQLGSSLVDIEPADLQGIAWHLVLPEGAGAGEKPNVLVERSLFQTAISAARHPWFGVLVMPEVMRQIAMEIASKPAALDDTETWIAPWAEFLAALGIEVPPETEDDDDAARQDWASQVVTRFAAKGVFRQHMNKAMDELEGKPA